MQNPTLSGAQHGRVRPCREVPGGIALDTAQGLVIRPCALRLGGFRPWLGLGDGAPSATPAPAPTAANAPRPLRLELPLFPSSMSQPLGQSVTCLACSMRLDRVVRFSSLCKLVAPAFPLVSLLGDLASSRCTPVSAPIPSVNLSRSLTFRPQKPDATRRSNRRTMPNEFPSFSIRFPFVLCIRTISRLCTTKHRIHFLRRGAQASAPVFPSVPGRSMRALGCIHADLDGSTDAL